MAGSSARLVALVAGTAVLGAIAGFAAGRLTQPDPATEAGPVLPLAAIPTSGSSPTPTTTPVVKKTPVPDDEPALDPDGLRYDDVELSVTKKPHPPVRLTLQAPRGWRVEPVPDRPDQVRIIDRTGKRWIRIESGFVIERPPIESMKILATNLRSSQPPENALTVTSQTDGPLVGRTGDSRNIATLEYTYIPNQSVRYVGVRWIGYGAPGNVAVEMSVTGLPQDKQALTEVLDRASTTILRFD